MSATRNAGSPLGGSIADLSAWLAVGQRLRFGCGRLVFTQFGTGDFHDLLHIRNHESVRKHMPDVTPLTPERHRVWCTSNLLCGSTLLFIGRNAVEPVGFTLLKRIGTGADMELGVMFVESFQRSVYPGNAAGLTISLALDSFDALGIVTYARPCNESSVRLNAGLGMRARHSDKEAELSFRADRATLEGMPIVTRNRPRLARGLTVLHPSDM